MHYHHLTREQRYAIYLGLQEGKSREAIARQIKVNPSTVGREIKRNSTRFGHYSWRTAQESADIRKERMAGNRRIDRNVMKEALLLLAVGMAFGEGQQPVTTNIMPWLR